jgi:hypothetical protein
MMVGMRSGWGGVLVCALLTGSTCGHVGGNSWHKHTAEAAHSVAEGKFAWPRLLFPAAAPTLCLLLCHAVSCCAPLCCASQRYLLEGTPPRG